MLEGCPHQLGMLATYLTIRWRIPTTEQRRRSLVPLLVLAVRPQVAAALASPNQALRAGAGRPLFEFWIANRVWGGWISTRSCGGGGG
jgi:hypothetical protein